MSNLIKTFVYWKKFPIVINFLTYQNCFYSVRVHTNKKNFIYFQINLKIYWYYSEKYMIPWLLTWNENGLQLVIKFHRVFHVNEISKCRYPNSFCIFAKLRSSISNWAINSLAQLIFFRKVRKSWAWQLKTICYALGKCCNR